MTFSPEAWQQVYEDQQEHSWQEATRSAPLIRFPLETIAKVSVFVALGVFLSLYPIHRLYQADHQYTLEMQEVAYHGR